MDESGLQSALYSRLTTVAILAAQRAGDEVARAFQTDFAVENKEGRHNFVTEIDKKAEDIIKETIKEFFPEHTFLAEEGGDDGANPGGIKWVIDPLDGTLNFVHHIPMFCISIAATTDGTPLSGVVYHPLLKELFVAEKGKGAFLNGRRLHVTEVDTLENAYLATGFPYNSHENPHHCIELVQEFLKLGSPLRRIGAAALDLAYLAAGRFDGFWEVFLKPWDYIAGRLLIEEAGGILTDFEGQPYNNLEEGPVIASNGLLHENLVKTIKAFEKKAEEGA